MSHANAALTHVPLPGTRLVVEDGWKAVGGGEVVHGLDRDGTQALATCPSRTLITIALMKEGGIDAFERSAGSLWAAWGTSA